MTREATTENCSFWVTGEHSDGCSFWDTGECSGAEATTTPKPSGLGNGPGLGNMKANFEATTTPGDEHEPTWDADGNCTHPSHEATTTPKEAQQ